MWQYERFELTRNKFRVGSLFGVSCSNKGRAVSSGPFRVNRRRYTGRLESYGGTRVPLVFVILERLGTRGVVGERPEALKEVWKLEAKCPGSVGCFRTRYASANRGHCANSGLVRDVRFDLPAPPRSVGENPFRERKTTTADGAFLRFAAGLPAKSSSTGLRWNEKHGDGPCRAFGTDAQTKRRNHVVESRARRDGEKKSIRRYLSQKYRCFTIDIAKNIDGCRCFFFHDYFFPPSRRSPARRSQETLLFCYRSLSARWSTADPNGRRYT